MGSKSVKIKRKAPQTGRAAAGTRTCDPFAAIMVKEWLTNRVRPVGTVYWESVPNRVRIALGIRAGPPLVLMATTSTLA